MPIRIRRVVKLKWVRGHATISNCCSVQQLRFALPKAEVSQDCWAIVFEKQNQLVDGVSKCEFARSVAAEALRKKTVRRS